MPEVNLRHPEMPGAGETDLTSSLTQPRDVPGPKSTLLPDSLFTSTKTKYQAIKLWEGDEPPPMQFLVEELVPKNFITILSGHSGLGKSYVALAIAFKVCQGQHFLSLKTKKTNVLWLDFELNEDELRRRSHQLARGMGLSFPPHGMYYFRPTTPLGSDATNAQVKKIMDANDIGLIIIDSLSIGSAGLDMNQQRDTVLLLKAIEKWGTSICIDHITKADARGNQGGATIFGSTFKRAVARSTLKLLKADGGGLTLQHDKTNFGPECHHLNFALRFDGHPLTVSIDSVAMTDPEMRGAAKHLNAAGRTLYHLTNLWKAEMRPIPLLDLVNETEVTKKTVQNHLTALGDKVKKHGDGTYSPIPIPDPLETGNRESNS